jgi:hypothetical protein
MSSPSWWKIPRNSITHNAIGQTFGYQRFGVWMLFNSAWSI